MNSNLKLLPAALLVAMLALAGCGGGDDAPAEPPVDTTPPPDPGPTALESAAAAQTMALAAQTAAENALEGAVAASKKLSAKDAGGSSQMASDNVMTVLSAEMTIQAQYETAKMAVMDAEAAHAAADEADKANIASIVMATKNARDAIKAIMDATGSDSLMEALERVRTGSDIGATAAKIAMDKAEAVAMAIQSALLSDGAAATIPPITDAAVIAAAPKGAIMPTAGAGETFAEITGGATMAATSIKDFTDNSGATAAPFAPATGTTTIPVSDSASASDVIYMGISGTFDCLTTCAYDKDGKISGSLHFVPDSQTNRYSQAKYGDPYTLATRGAVYGHWLTATETATTVNLHATSQSTSLQWNNGAAAGESETDVSATYRGDAGGYSARNIGTRTKPQFASGEFAANVELKAVFKDTVATSTLNGSISGFSGGNHVNPSWYVTLTGPEGGLADGAMTGTVPAGNMVGRENASGGAWTASGYGTADKNPSGFVGTFNAAFSDGGAAGTYHAEVAE